MTSPKKPVNQRYSTGLIIRIIVKNPDNVRRLPFRALIDTGATTSGISIRVARELELEPVEALKINAAGSLDKNQRIPLYRVEIDVPSVPRSRPVKFALGWESLGRKPMEEIDALIGHDFLKQCRLCFDGPTGEATLTLTG